MNLSFSYLGPLGHSGPIAKNDTWGIVFDKRLLIAVSFFFELSAYGEWYVKILDSFFYF